MRVDKNIPIPPINIKRGSKYPWEEMGVGDSMLFVGMRVNGVCPQATKAGRRLGWKFTVRKVENGVRVWRVE